MRGIAGSFFLFFLCSTLSVAAPPATSPSAPLATHKLFLVPYPIAGKEYRVQATGSLVRTLPHALMPVLDAQTLYFNDGAHIVAASLLDGRPPRAWLETYPATHGVYKAKLDPSQAGLTTIQPLTVVIDGPRLLALVGLEPAPTRFDLSGPDTPARRQLVCLDLRSGGALWSFGPDELKAPEVAGMELEGVPLVADQSVYIVGRQRLKKESITHLFCLDPASGKVRWRKVVQTVLETVRHPRFDPFPPSELSYFKRRIYVLTHTGVLACIDSGTGQLVWQDVYEKPQQDEPEPWRRSAAAVSIPEVRRPRPGRSLVVTQGYVFSLPSDANWLSIYTAAEGKPVKRIPGQVTIGGSSVSIQQIDAIEGDQMYLSGPTPSNNCGLVWVDWVKCVPVAAQSHELVGDSLIYVTFLSPAAGHVAIGSGYAFVPLSTTAVAIDTRRQRVVQVYPTGFQTWPAEEGPGNMVVSGERWIMAGPKGITVYGPAGE